MKLRVSFAVPEHSKGILSTDYGIFWLIRLLYFAATFRTTIEFPPSVNKVTISFFSVKLPPETYTLDLIP
jgi:hypothetical protein